MNSKGDRNTLFVVGADVGSVGKPEVRGEKVMGSFKVPAPQCQSSPDPRNLRPEKRDYENHYDHLIKGLNFRPYFLEGVAFWWVTGGPLRLDSHDFYCLQPPPFYETGQWNHGTTSNPKTNVTLCFEGFDYHIKTPISTKWLFSLVSGI